jgi:hypothetical protein
MIDLPSITLSNSSLGAGISGAFVSSGSGTPSFSRTLTVSTSGAANPGATTFTVTGTDSRSPEGGSRTSGTATLNVWDFTIALSPSDRTVLRGASTTYTAAVTLVSGSAGNPANVPLALSGAPSDATVTGFPASLAFGASQQFTVQAANSSTGSLGDFALVATSNVDCGSRSASAGLHLYDFSVTISGPNSTPVQRGCSNSYTVNVNLAVGSSTTGLRPITLAVMYTSTTPSNVAASFSASPIPGGSSMLTLSPATTSSLGSFPFQVRGTDSAVPEGGSRDSSPAATPLQIWDFSLTVTPNPLVAALNQGVSYSVKLTLLAGSAGTIPAVDLSSILPVGVTGSFDTTPLTPTLAGAMTVLNLTASTPGSFSITVVAGGGCGTRQVTAMLEVLNATVGGLIRDTSCSALPNGADAVFTPGGGASSGLKLAATNPGGFMYLAKFTNLGPTTSVGFVLDLAKYMSEPTSQFPLWGSNPVKVFSGDPCGPGATDITPMGIQIVTPSGPLNQPLSTNSTTAMSPGSITVPTIPSVPTNGQVWVQVHIRSGLLGTTGWPANSQTAFARGYLFNSKFVVGGTPLTNPEATPFAILGKRFTGIGGWALDLNDQPKDGLQVLVNATCGGGGGPTTQTVTGFYVVQLAAGTSGDVRLCNAMGEAVSPVMSFTAPLAADEFRQIDFLNLNPADPVIDGIVGTSSMGVGGIRVELIGSGNRVVSQTVTNSGGYYVFRFTPPGTYTVRITPPTGYNAATRSVTLTIRMFERKKVDFVLMK